ncbi:MAG: SUMF1/EgtB/PvdO family nonheme iron enzyme [Bacteroidota bacterium]
MRGTASPLLRAEAGRTLDQLGDPRPEVTTLEHMAFCLVPAGSFELGSNEKEDKDAYPDEAPRHTYDIPYAYGIGQYPVTQAQYQRFVEAEDGYTERDNWTDAGWTWRNSREVTGPEAYRDPFGLLNHPVVGVSWYEAQAFTVWLTRHAHAQGWLPSGWQVALHNEPEWEKAARGGHQLPLHVVVAPLAGFAEQTAPRISKQNPKPYRRYPWGADSDAQRMNYHSTGIGATSAVGCFPQGQSPYGAEELSGNVLEWSRSRWEEKYPYPKCSSRALHKREALESGSRRVLRGGAFDNIRQNVRAAFRLYNFPNYRDLSVGFRVVLLPPR